MLQSRSSSRTRAKNLSNSPSPSSRLGRLFPPFGRNSVVASLGSNLLLRPVELSPVDPHAMQNDRELTRDRDEFGIYLSDRGRVICELRFKIAHRILGAEVDDPRWPELAREALTKPIARQAGIMTAAGRA